MIVIDASALLEMLLRTGRADRLMARALGASERLHAPHLLDIEVTQAVRRLVQREEITIVRAEQVLDDFAHLLVEPGAEGELARDVKDCPAAESDGQSPNPDGGKDRRS